MNENAVLTRNLQLLFHSSPGSIQDFSLKYYISEQTISKWLHGNFKIFTWTHILLISEFFHVPTDWLSKPHRNLNDLKTNHAEHSKKEGVSDAD